MKSSNKEFPFDETGHTAVNKNFQGEKLSIRQNLGGGNPPPSLPYHSSEA
jgi:hypothetical protein